MSGSEWLAGLLAALAISCATYASPVGTERFDRLFQDGPSNPVYIYVAGLISGIIFVPILTSVLKRVLGHSLSSKDEGAHDLYRLDHGVLNIKLPPPSMWMNMGYWKDTTDFPDACRALLDEVLITAGLLGQDRLPPRQPRVTRPRVIDLGFGCGDQSVYLAQLQYKSSPERTGGSAIDGGYLFDRYIGLTIAPSQCAFASKRLSSCASLDTARVQLFCADAAKPAFWSKDIHEAITNNPTEESRTEPGSTQFKSDNWILGLDTLYHFKPSRENIFRHAFGELDASIMAFDLLLSDAPSFWDLFLLRIVSLFAETPFSNFITVAQYKNQLCAAGYDEDKIEVRDVSGDVFPGIASFIGRRDRELNTIGMTIGRYNVAGKMFGWWARSGIVRGCIIVAKR